MKKIQSFLLLIAILLTFTANSETLNTGNILTNSTFGTGTTYDTTGWTIDDHTHGHNYMSSGGGNDPGGSVAAEENTSISQTVSLADDTNMLTEEIQQGWESTLSSDIWFWNNYNNTTTLKQTITGSDGSVTTQERIIEDTGCDYINCNQFENYSDTYVQGSNTQTDFNIKVDVTNTNNLTGHWGPDIDNVELSVSYTKFNPISTDIQEDLAIEEIDFKIEDKIEFDDVKFEEVEFTKIELKETFDEPIEEIIQEEFFEEDFNIIEEEFAESEIEEFKEEEVVEEEFAQEEEVIEETEEPTEEVAENEEIEEEKVEEVAEEITEESQDVDVAEQKNSIEIQVSDNVKVEIKEVSLFNNEALDSYENVPFYKNQDIYSNVDQGFFIQADLSIYNKPFYINLTLDNYISNDVIDIKQKKLYDLRVQKMELVIELQKLRDLL